MQEFLAMTYYWLKAGHVIFMIFWMAGLFILPRQMVYMHASPAGSEEETLWAERTRTLAKVILIPSIILDWAELHAAQASGSADTIDAGERQSRNGSARPPPRTASRSPG